MPEAIARAGRGLESHGRRDLNRHSARAALAGALCGLAVSAAAAAEANLGNVCDRLYSPSWKPVIGKVVSSVPSAPRPAKGLPLRDAALGTCVVRVTEHDRDPPKGFARNDYSRRQAFNANSTRMLIIAQDGAWHLYDADTFAQLETLSELKGDAEPQWHPTDPNILYFMPRNGVGMKLFDLNLRTGIQQVTADFGERLRARWPSAAAASTKSEGSPSADGRFWCFIAFDEKWKTLGLFTWDATGDRIVGMRDLPAAQAPDHVSMSPSGKYCVSNAHEAPGVLAYTQDLKSVAKVAAIGEHSDIALDANGDDTYVSIDYEARGGPVYMVNLRTGVRTDLFPTYLEGTTTAVHFSGKAYANPGWVVMTTYDEQVVRGHPERQWLHGKVFALSLKPDPAIVPLVHHRSVYAKYWTAPVASTNRELTRVLFNSNWDSGSPTDVDAYMVVLPAGALTRKP